MKSVEAVGRLQRVFGEITYKPWRQLRMDCEYDITSQDIHIIVSWVVQDVTHKQHWPVKVDMQDRIKLEEILTWDDEQIAAWFFDTICEMEGHETREWFKWKGEPKHGPHPEEEVPF